MRTHFSLLFAMLIFLSALTNSGCSKDGKTGKVKDIDGNTYNTVVIGNQVWMAENLRVTRFSDGTPITLVTGGMYMGLTPDPQYSWYNDDKTTYGATYGALYSWYAVGHGKLCPVGWHVPSDAEWETLQNYLGGESVAGGHLKEAGTAHWNSPNAGATNSSGFTALPGGLYFEDISDNLGKYGTWWSTTTSPADEAYVRTLHYTDAKMSKAAFFKNFGFSVRCLKD